MCIFALITQWQRMITICILVLLSVPLLWPRYTACCAPGPARLLAHNWRHTCAPPYTQMLCRVQHQLSLARLDKTNGRSYGCRRRKVGFDEQRVWQGCWTYQHVFPSFKTVMGNQYYASTELNLSSVTVNFLWSQGAVLDDHLHIAVQLPLLKCQLQRAQINWQ